MKGGNVARDCKEVVYLLNVNAPGSLSITSPSSDYVLVYNQSENLQLPIKVCKCPEFALLVRFVGKKRYKEFWCEFLLEHEKGVS